MSSTKKWLEVLDKAGRGAEMVKIDWASAYKHVAVRRQDIELQFFHWLGKDFVELCLVFGGRSSAGIYDRLAKLVLKVVILFCNFLKWFANTSMMYALRALAAARSSLGLKRHTVKSLTTSVCNSHPRQTRTRRFPPPPPEWSWGYTMTP
jgi:hypothetical protein